MENEEENFGENPEALCWSQLHKCCTAISQALGRSNRLDALIGFFALWLAKSQDKEQQVEKALIIPNDQDRQMEQCQQDHQWCRDIVGEAEK